MVDTAVKYSSCFRWETKLFSRFCERNHQSTKYSNLFSLPDEPATKFGFSFYPGFGNAADTFSIILKELDGNRVLKLRIQFWAENQTGIRFGPRGKLKLPDPNFILTFQKQRTNSEKLATNVISTFRLASLFRSSIAD
jgi:hypothetical protein